MSREYIVHSRVWVSGLDGNFLGAGRVRLLREIHTTGSISEAARKLGMSYKKAWTAIDAMNRESSDPLVVKSTGGRNGGGALVTAVGQAAIDRYQKLVLAINDCVAQHLKETGECDWSPESPAEREA